MPPRNFVLQRLKITVFRFSNFMIDINYKYLIPSKFSKIIQNPEVQEHCVNPDSLTCWDIFGEQLFLPFQSLCRLMITMSFWVSSALDCSLYRWRLYVYFTFPLI